jgi:hypothetical protein
MVGQPPVNTRLVEVMIAGQGSVMFAWLVIQQTNAALSVLGRHAAWVVGLCWERLQRFSRDTLAP